VVLSDDNVVEIVRALRPDSSKKSTIYILSKSGCEKDKTSEKINCKTINNYFIFNLYIF
jgi:hypothetical protein